MRKFLIVIAVAYFIQTLVFTVVGTAIFFTNTYPDWSGGWTRYVPPVTVISASGLRTPGGQPSFDQTKPWGFGQQAPLTAEYRRVLEDSIADQANGGQGNFAHHALCLPGGMPFMMIAFRPIEFVVTPKTTYILIGGSEHYRRIYTDGREWPKEITPTFSGFSIGKWVGDTLEVETRGFKGPRVYDASGLPLHFDNQSVFKEKIYLDKDDKNLLHDEITVVDNALTRPWTVDKKYTRNPKETHPEWEESYCTEENALVGIGKEIYWIGADGLLMPARKDQTPPDLRHFK